MVVVWPPDLGVCSSLHSLLPDWRITYLTWYTISWTSKSLDGTFKPRHQRYSKAWMGHHFYAYRSSVHCGVCAFDAQRETDFVTPEEGVRPDAPVVQAVLTIVYLRNKEDFSHGIWKCQPNKGLLSPWKFKIYKCDFKPVTFVPEYLAGSHWFCWLWRPVWPDRPKFGVLRKLLKRSTNHLNKIYQIWSQNHFAYRVLWGKRWSWRPIDIRKLRESSRNRKSTFPRTDRSLRSA